MKTKRTATILISTLLAITLSAQADDATLSRQLLGAWRQCTIVSAFGLNCEASDGRIRHLKPGEQFCETQVLKKDGTMTSSNNCDNNSLVYGWSVRDGVFHQTKKNGETVKDSSFKIISLTDRKFVIQDMYHGRGTASWTRITPASGESASSR
jgi:hypothetical protein